MKSKYLKHILIIPIIIWMGIVFKFSNQPADVSDHTSSNVTKIIVEIFAKKDISEEEKTELIEKYDPAVRKFAHFTIYAIGGFLIMIYVNAYNIKETKKILYSWGVGSFYALTDEIHQIFIPGRAGEITDVILDSIGILTGVCTSLLIIKIIKNIKIKNNEQ